MNDSPESDHRNGLEIAIIGMVGRFPGAKNIDEFWQNLQHGVESVSFFSEEELKSSGVASTLLNDHHYVKAGAILNDIELFDAAFFGVNPREAEVMDPQHRVFLECAWEALESAGYDSERYDGAIGVFAGISLNIQTACSTSLVAVCVACQSLLNYQCDMALAGAVSISFPQKTGYFSQAGGIASPD